MTAVSKVNRQRVPYCPQCKSKRIILIEEWTWGMIPFEQDADGLLYVVEHDYGGGDPERVRGVCRECEKVWTVRGMHQISQHTDYENDRSYP